MPLTDFQKQDYIDRGGVACPNCGSVHLQKIVTAHIRDRPEILVQMYCRDCRLEWIDSYTLTATEGHKHARVKYRI